jgi:hypothetical protein
MPTIAVVAAAVDVERSEVRRRSNAVESRSSCVAEMSEAPWERRAWLWVFGAAVSVVFFPPAMWVKYTASDRKDMEGSQRRRRRR